MYQRMDYNNMTDKDKIKEGVRLILEGIGEDVTREGLLSRKW